MGGVSDRIHTSSICPTKQNYNPQSVNARKSRKHCAGLFQDTSDTLYEKIFICQEIVEVNKSNVSKRN